uniref:Uncharacterized protein n=1 Tax=Molossus molossus TaxID=27622 RepID=A0A7J8FT19_MOLMO|nr:hypothetical protein HJG59_008424 [Molossus molossus]
MGCVCLQGTAGLRAGKQRAVPRPSRPTLVRLLLLMSGTPTLSFAKNMTLSNRMQNTLNLKLKYIKLEVYVLSDKTLLYFSQKFKISHSTGHLGAVGALGHGSWSPGPPLMGLVVSKGEWIGCCKRLPGWSRGLLVISWRNIISKQNSVTVEG